MNFWIKLFGNSARNQLAPTPARRDELDTARSQPPSTEPHTSPGRVRMVKKTGSGAFALVGLIATALATSPASGAEVLCTMFPMYQIAQNVAQGRDGTKVALLLPASLGCPHHYSLTPQDMQKLARADVLVVNGLGMEEFFGAPVKRANPRLVVVDSSKGIEELLPYSGGGHDHHPHGDEPYEWAGAFHLQPGLYQWTFATRDGRYTDPGMKMLILASDAEGEAAFERERPAAAKLMAGVVASKKAGEELQPGRIPFALEFDPSVQATAFRVRIEKAGTYVFFTEHVPTEFEADEHYFKDAEGRDVEPVAQEPEEDHAHAHGHGHDAEHGHHHHHQAINPHLFASPRMAAQLAMNIAAGLSKTDPDGAGLYFKNAQAYAERMNALADEMAALVKTLKNNRIVQPHGVFDYFARDIGLEIVAVTQPHGQEPSAAEMLKLAETIRTKQAGAVFTEPQYSPKVGQTLARETNIPAAVLDPVASGPENAPLDYYEQIMRKNMETLRATLRVKE